MEAIRYVTSAIRCRKTGLTHAVMAIATQTFIAAMLTHYVNAHAASYEQLRTAFALLSRMLLICSLSWIVYALCAETLWHLVDVDVHGPTTPWGGTLFFQTGLLLAFRMHLVEKMFPYSPFDLPLEESPGVPLAAMAAILLGLLLLCTPHSSSSWDT